MATIKKTSNDVKRMFEKVETLTAAETLTSADTGKTFILDATAGKTIVLPALEAGLNFKFIVGAAFASTNWIIDSAEGDNMEGIIADMGETPAGVPVGAEDQINFVASAESIGDWVELTCDFGNTQWLVTGMCRLNGGITATDPS